MFVCLRECKVTFGKFVFASVFCNHTLNNPGDISVPSSVQNNLSVSPSLSPRYFFWFSHQVSYFLFLVCILTISIGHHSTCWKIFYQFNLLTIWTGCIEILSISFGHHLSYRELFFNYFNRCNVNTLFTLKNFDKNFENKKARGDFTLLGLNFWAWKNLECSKSNIWITGTIDSLNVITNMTSAL